MKKIISLLLIFTFIFSLSAFAQEEPQSITVILDGEKLDFDVEPIIEDGRTLVPMRVIFEELGAEVDWDNDTFTAIGVKDDVTVKISIDNSVMLKNDEKVILDVPARLINGRTLVPARAVSEALGATVEWNHDTWTVEITSKESYVPGEYNYKELSPADLELLRTMYTDIFTTYAIDTLYTNMAQYPEDVSELIDKKDERIRMFADDVWNNLMAHVILNIQLQSKDMYIFDIPEDVELNSYSLMDDYLTLTEKEEMSSEVVLTSSFETTPKGKNILLINLNYGDVVALDRMISIGVVPTDTDFRFFVFGKPGIRNIDTGDVAEITPDRFAVVSTVALDEFPEALDEIIERNPPLVTQMETRGN